MDVEAVNVFSDAMLHEFQANSYKNGSNSLTRREHSREIEYHRAKLIAAMHTGESPERVLEFAADVANHALMAASSYGDLNKALYKRTKESPYVQLSWKCRALILLRHPIQMVKKLRENPWEPTSYGY